MTAHDASNPLPESRELTALREQLAEAQTRIMELEAQPRLVPAPPEVPLGFDPDDLPLY